MILCVCMCKGEYNNYYINSKLLWKKFWVNKTELYLLKIEIHEVLMVPDKQNQIWLYETRKAL